MLAIYIIINLAKIMLILNGLNVTLNKVDGASSSTSSRSHQHEPDMRLMQREIKESKDVPVGIMDFVNIRHERSKQRRHATSEQKPHSTRIFYENRPENKGLHLQHDNHGEQRKDVTVENIDDTTTIELQKNSRNFRKSKSNDINIGLVSSSGINVLSNVTGNLVNANDDEGKKSTSNAILTINDVLEATEATHYLTPPKTTFKAVTHRIRKLHKKKIVESLRQLNIKKLNRNGGVGVGASGSGGDSNGDGNGDGDKGFGHLTKNHHRSLLEAEHMQQQQAVIKHTNEISQTVNIINQQSQQQQATIVASTDANGTHQVARELNKNEADMATNDIESNVHDSTNKMAKDNAVDGVTNDDGNSDSDDGVDVAQQDNDGSLSNDFYQNDDNNLNDGIDEFVSDIDLLSSSTLDSLMDDKFDKQFKNLSSEFLKDIDNNVDLDDNGKENETFILSWPQKKDRKLSPINLTNGPAIYNPLVHNLTEDSFLYNISTSTEIIYGISSSSTDHAVESLPSVNSRETVEKSGPKISRFYEKKEINFNDFNDSLAQDDVSYTKNLAMDKGFSDNNDVVFPISELDELDSNSDDAAETEGDFEVASDDETNHFLEGVVDAANSEEIYDWDEISRSNRRDLMHGRDVVTKFLQIVETQHSLGSNCEAGTSLNLGEGVVDRYAQDRFRIEAEVAVNRANMLTRIFKMTSAAAQADVNLLHASVLSMVEFDDDIFAAGNCFDWNEHPSQPGLFCPFAYRLPPPNLGAILAKDLAMEYHYLGNTSEWFFQARKNAEKVIARNEQYLKAFHLYSNKTDERIEDDTLAVKYEDGRWSKPYYDCGGGNIWMLTYTVPFFGYENSTYHFKGTSGIDIDLRRVDIDQCPQRNIPGSTKPLNIFAGTDKCKQRTTMCEAIQGLGFRRGSYKCVCRKGYYFPDTTSQHKYFNGSLLEEEYEKLMLGKNSTYNIINEYECLACAEGCDSCEDGSPCIAALNWPMRTSILALACVVIGLLPPAAWFTFRYQQVKVVRAASPALLRVIALGAFFIYCTNIVMYPNPNLYTCTGRIWLREIGFSLTYGALMLKTWRISVIFRVRSAKAVKITDAALLKRLGCICGAIGTCLLVRTLVSPPDVVVGRTADDLKAFLCKTDWWDYTFTSMEVVFLAWGVRLCIMVRKAPSEFNESRFISMAIYNEFLLTCFLNVSMLFLQSPANPDLLYIIFFCHTQLTITLLLALIFGSKVYIVLRSGKSHQENIGMGAKSSGAKFNFRPQVRTFANPSSVTTSTAPVAVTTSAEIKLSDQEALEEIRQLSIQLQRIQDMAPPKGVAVMTISSLLDGLKAPTSMAVTTTAASHAPGVGLSGNQLAVRTQKPEALPLLSLNTEIQKYQQLQVSQKAKTATTAMMLTTTTNNNVAVMQSIPSVTLPSIQLSPTLTLTPAAATAFNRGITATAQWKENAVNTEFIGNCLAEQKQLHEHIICQRCYEKCKSQQHYDKSTGRLDKCKILGSPQLEGSISFKDIKLDCMCSQSDDLDQLTEQEPIHHTVRRITKRTAATNTPPNTTRKSIGHSSSLQPAKDAKAISSVSLPSDANCSKSPQKSISFISQQQKQQERREHQKSPQQICDNCRNKFKTKASLGKTKSATARPQSQEHRKLSRLNSRCNKLIADIENSKRIHITTTAQQQKPYDCDGAQYSTDDIFFYTTTDTDDESDSDSDDDEDHDETEGVETANKEDDQSAILSHSKSEDRVPQKLKPHLATLELRCISLSMGNITTTSTTSSASQVDTGESKNSLLATNTIQVITAAMDPAVAAASSTSQQTSNQTQSQQHQQQSVLTSTAPPALSPTSAAAASAATTGDSNGSNNGKAKRPDKLVLNLNDRSKFTKEVSV